MIFGSGKGGCRMASKHGLWVVSRILFLFFPFLPFLIFPDLSLANGFLPDASQSKCYDNSGEIPCPAPGEPFYGQDANYLGPQMAYEVSADGLVVTDLNTGLMWQQVDDGVQRKWEDASLYCEDLVLRDYSDWRLPSFKELLAIVDYGRSDPAINPAFSCQYDALYWSGTTLAWDVEEAWDVGFDDGTGAPDEKSDAFYVRCVRGGYIPGSFVNNGDGTVSDTSTGLTWQQADDGLQRNWQEALSYCESLELAEKTDWRLPNLRELVSIVDYGRTDPAVNPAFNCREQGYYSYWSGNTLADDTRTAHIVSCMGGNMGYGWKSSSSLNVRCVRGGATFAGDIDHDQDADGKDLALLISNFLNSAGDPRLAIFAAAFGRTDLL
jgi:hypothetical protein